MSRPTWFNTLLYLGTTILTSLLGLGAALLMTHLLHPDQYGRIGVFLSVLYIAMPLVSLAAEGLIAVNKSNLSNTEYEDFRRTATAIALLVFATLQVGAVILWSTAIVKDPLLLVVPFFALLRFASSMAATEYVAEQRAVTYSMLTLLNSIVALALTWLLLTYLTQSAAGRIASLMVAESLLLWFRYRGRLRTLFHPQLHQTYTRQIVSFGVPSMIALFGAWALNESDKAVVAQVFGLSTAGFYTAAATLASVMASFNQSLTNALYPGLFARLREPRVRLTHLMATYMLRFVLINAAFAALVVFVYAMAKGALLPAKYSASSEYFYALVAASLGVALYRPLGLFAEFFQMARVRAIAIVGGGGATLLTSIVGTRIIDTPLIAALGIGVGYAVTSLVLWVALTMKAREKDEEAEAQT